MRKRALRGGNEGRAQALHVGFGHFARRLPALAERNGRSGNRRPWIGFALERAAAFPRFLRRALAAGMRDLNAELGGAGAARRMHDARQRRLIVVVVKTEAAVGDAAVALDMGRLHDHQRGAGIRQHAEMHQVPVVGAAVVARILAHRRDHDAVGKLETGESIGREKGTAHGRGTLKREERVQRRWMDFKYAMMAPTSSASNLNSGISGWPDMKPSPRASSSDSTG